MTKPDSPSNARTPAAAARSAAPAQSGRCATTSSRLPILDVTPMAAPNPWTRATATKARNALGVCNSVMTEDASWITANARAAISSGPPRAEASTQRSTSHEVPSVVARAVVRAVPHITSRTGIRGRTPSSRPLIEIGTECTASHALAIAPGAPSMSLPAMSNCSSTIAEMRTSAMMAGPNATRTRSRA